jgi:hypothetical protein
MSCRVFVNAPPDQDVPHRRARWPRANTHYALRQISACFWTAPVSVCQPGRVTNPLDKWKRLREVLAVAEAERSPVRERNRMRDAVHLAAAAVAAGVANSMFLTVL